MIQLGHKCSQCVCPMARGGISFQNGPLPQGQIPLVFCNLKNPALGDLHLQCLPYICSMLACGATKHRIFYITTDKHAARLFCGCGCPRAAVLHHSCCSVAPLLQGAPSSYVKITEQPKAFDFNRQQQDAAQCTLAGIILAHSGGWGSRIASPRAAVQVQDRPMPISASRRGLRRKKEVSSRSEAEARRGTMVSVRV